jgi:hypothetical protein
MKSLAALACVTFLANLLLAQDPPAPPGGFAIVETPDQDIVWSDGYRTRVDTYRPAVMPPATGWPGVMAMHGGGGDRKIPTIVGIGRYLAARGYVVHAYDCSFEGETLVLNPGWPTPRGEDRVLLDSAESHGAVQALLPGFIDGARLAVTGTSLGGKHALQAAGWSGRALPLAGAVTHYPVVRACAPEIASVDALGDNLHGGVLVSDEYVEGRPPTDPLLLLLDVEDYPGILTLSQASITAQTLGMVGTSTVPLFTMLAWQDFKHQNNRSVDAVAGFTQPRRLFLTAGGHSTPMNQHERALMQDLRRRWFDRYLKGVANGVELETAVEAAVEPDQPAYLDLGSIWEHRRSPTWPPAGTSQTFYLRGNRSLTAVPPPAPEVGVNLNHVVPAGYSAQEYVAQGAGEAPARVFARITRLAFDYDTVPMPQPMELVGRSGVELHVGDTTGTFQLSASLFHVEPGGAEHPITIGTEGRRGTAPGAQLLRIELADCAHVIPAGNRLRLRLLNLADHQAPSYRRVRYVPYFTSTNTTVRVEPGAASRLVLSLRPYETNLRPRLGVASVAAGINHGMSLNGGPARAGFLAVTLLGQSGEAPGIPLPGLPPLPVQIDALTQLGLLSLGTPAFPDFLAVLNASGRATPTLRVPPAAAGALLGLRFTFGGVVFDPALALESVFGPTTLVIDP